MFKEAVNVEDIVMFFVVFHLLSTMAHLIQKALLFLLVLLEYYHIVQMFGR